MDLIYELQGTGLDCAFDAGVNGGQMEILGTRKNKKAFCVQACSWGRKMAVFWSDFSGREGQGVELLLLLFCLFLWLCSPELKHWCAWLSHQKEQRRVSF